MISTFLWKIFSDTKPDPSVTERNTLVYMVGHEVVPYTPHEHHPFDRIFSGGGKMGFLYFLFLDSARWFHMCLNPHQLPKETMCIQWNYFDVHPHICTSATLVTENHTCSVFLIQPSRSVKPTSQRAAVLSLVSNFIQGAMHETNTLAEQDV